MVVTSVWINMHLSTQHTKCTHMRTHIHTHMHMCAYALTHACTHTLTYTHAHTLALRYLTENLSPPSTIPISVKLTFPEKGFEATDIVLKPDETMASIVKRLQSLMVEKGMEIIHFPSLDEMDVSFVRLVIMQRG